MDNRLNRSFLVGLILAILAGAAIHADVEPKPPINGSESKHLMGESREQWILQMRGALAINKLQTGPFGLSQDLTLKKVAPSEKLIVKTNAFPKAVNALKIDIIAANGKSFYIGFREFKKGQIFPLEYGKNKFKVKVTSITKKGMAFENVETGEQVIKKDKEIPDGMKAGGDINLKGVNGVTEANDRDPGSVVVPEK